MTASGPICSRACADNAFTRSSASRKAIANGDKKGLRSDIGVAETARQPGDSGRPKRPSAARKAPRAVARRASAQSVVNHAEPPATRAMDTGVD